MGYQIDSPFHSSHNVTFRKNRKQPLDTQKNQTSPVQRLPDEMLMQIFSFLSPAERTRTGMTCQHWHSLTKDSAFSTEDNAAKQFHLFGKAASAEVSEENEKAAMISKYDSVLLPQSSLIRIVLISNSAKLKNTILNLPDAQQPNENYENSYMRAAGMGTRIVSVGGNQLHLIDAPYSERYVPTLKTYLKHANIILFYPDESQAITTQLQTLDERLKSIGANDRIVLIVNGDFNAGRYLSVAFEKNDNIQTFYARVFAAMHEARNQLLDVSDMDAGHEVVNNRNRCIVS